MLVKLNLSYKTLLTMALDQWAREITRISTAILKIYNGPHIIHRWECKFSLQEENQPSPHRFPVFTISSNMKRWELRWIFSSSLIQATKARWERRSEIKKQKDLGWIVLSSQCHPAWAFLVFALPLLLRRSLFRSVLCHKSVSDVSVDDWWYLTHVKKIIIIFYTCAVSTFS